MSVVPRLRNLALHLTGVQALSQLMGEKIGGERASAPHSQAAQCLPARRCLMAGRARRTSPEFGFRLMQSGLYDIRDGRGPEATEE